MTKSRYAVEESRIAPGTFNVVDTKRVIAVHMHKSREDADKLADGLNR